jgi:hypothetical protein
MKGKNPSFFLKVVLPLCLPFCLLDYLPACLYTTNSLISVSLHIFQSAVAYLFCLSVFHAVLYQYDIKIFCRGLRKVFIQIIVLVWRKFIHA